MFKQMLKEERGRLLLVFLLGVVILVFPLKVQAQVAGSGAVGVGAGSGSQPASLGAGAGVTPLSGGAGATTTFETVLTFNTPWSIPVILVAFLAGVLVILLTWWNLQRSGKRKKWVIISLRFLTVLMVLFLFLEPAVQEQIVTRVRSHLVVLADSSLSMGITDRQGGPTRAILLRDFVLANGEEWKNLSQEHQIHVYKFDSSLHPSSLDQVGEGPEWASGAGTDLGAALDEVAKVYGNRNLAAVLVLSDGADNGPLGAGTPPRGQIPQEMVEKIVALGVPIHTVLIGEPHALNDLSIHSISADTFAFVKNLVQVKAVVRARGLGTRDVPISLKENGKTIQTRVIRMSPATTEYVVDFSFAPQKVGKRVYTVEGPVLEGEGIPENNRQHFVMDVVRDRIRVLQVCGQPSWDERFLREYFKSNPSVDLISFFILRTSANMAMVSNHELSLIPFPTNELFEEELGSFDLVVLQNFNFGPYQIGKYLPKIEEFVAKGGGLAMVGGALSFSAGGYGGTRVEDALPVTLPPRGQDSDMFLTSPYSVRVPQSGKHHPVIRLADDWAGNMKAWRDMDGFAGLNVVTGVRPEGVVLLEAVPATGPARSRRAQPLLVVGRYGEGRSMALLSDSGWRMGFSHSRSGQGGPASYRRFWNNAMGWLIGDPDVEQVRVEAEARQVAWGEQVAARVQMVDQAYEAEAGVRFTASLHSLGDGGFLKEPVQVREGVLGEQGAARVEFAQVPRGAYLIVARGEDRTGRPGVGSPGGGGGGGGVGGAGGDEKGGLLIEDGLSFAPVIVTGAGAELNQPWVRDDLLAGVSRASGGMFTGPRTKVSSLRIPSPDVVRSDRRNSRDLWTNPFMLLAVLGLMGVEWFVRKKYGHL